MKVKFCLPILETTQQAVWETLEAHRNEYDMFEVWIDYLEEPTEVILNLIRDLSNELQERLVIVFRRKNGDAIRMEKSYRMEIIKLLEKTKTFIDLDIEKQREDLEKIKEERLRPNIIASLHDYEKTPRTSSLVKIIKDMDMFEPAIYKIATFCQNEKQAVSLLHLLLDLKEQHKKCIILGMGKYGVITRIFGTLWGNEMIFAPSNGSEESAPGQLTKKQLDEILTIVEK